MAANMVYTATSSAVNLPHACHQAGTWLDTAYSKLQNTEQFALTIEVELGIEKHWTLDTEEYKEFYQHNMVTDYVKALNELERLVVMCLFELAKLSTSGTGT